MIKKITFKTFFSVSLVAAAATLSQASNSSEIDNSSNELYLKNGQYLQDVKDLDTLKKQLQGTKYAEKLNDYKYRNEILMDLALEKFTTKEFLDESNYSRNAPDNVYEIVRVFTNIGRYTREHK